jgi:hypothetical protein
MDALARLTLPTLPKIFRIALRDTPANLGLGVYFLVHLSKR